METTGIPLALSIYSALLSTALGMLGFIYARREFRRSGWIVRAHLVVGRWNHREATLFLHDPLDRKDDYLVSIDASSEKGIELDSGSVVGVRVENSGRAPVVIRQVRAQQSLIFRGATLDAVIKLGFTKPSLAQHDFRTSYGGTPPKFFSGPTLPIRLEGGASEYWTILEDLLKRPGTVSFNVWLDTGVKLETAEHDIDGE